MTRSQPTRCGIGAPWTASLSHRVGTGQHGTGRPAGNAASCGTRPRGEGGGELGGFGGEGVEDDSSKARPRVQGMEPPDGVVRAEGAEPRPVQKI